MFWTLLERELGLAWRQGGAIALTVLFFVLAVSLFPLGLGPEVALLRRISAGVIWVAALLACLLSLDRMFQADFEDGTLDILLTSPMAPILMVGTKVLAHWISSILPLILISPVLGILMGVHSAALWILPISLLAGTPALSLIGAVGAALTVGLRRGGVLLSLLVMPLYVPVLIFGAAAAHNAMGGLPFGDALLLLLACSLLAAAVAPPAAAAAIKLAAE